jgi:hypothetical protein
MADLADISGRKVGGGETLHHGPFPPDHLTHGPTRLSYGVDLSPSPVTVSVPLDALARLCRLAREAGEDLQEAARREYPSDNPSSVRRRNNEIAAAQEIIDAAAGLSR